MRMDLMELLRSKAIAHPTIINSISVEGGNVRVRVSGWPWWDASSEKKEGKIEFVFEGVSEGEIEIGVTNSNDHYFNEALEDFEIKSLNDVAWAQPNSQSVYCSSPIPRPWELYALLHDHLVKEGSFKRPADFLNSAQTFESFYKIAASNSFMVAHCPEVICKIVCDELIRQGVPHNVLSRALNADTRLWVRLNEADFLCQTATAIFE